MTQHKKFMNRSCTLLFFLYETPSLRKNSSLLDIVQRPSNFFLQPPTLRENLNLGAAKQAHNFDKTTMIIRRRRCAFNCLDLLFCTSAPPPCSNGGQKFQFLSFLTDDYNQ
jgi:hypothetical protein